MRKTWLSSRDQEHRLVELVGLLGSCRKGFSTISRGRCSWWAGFGLPRCSTITGKKLGAVESERAVEHLAGLALEVVGVSPARYTAASSRSRPRSGRSQQA
jgi:hypothetical protein